MRARARRWAGVAGGAVIAVASPLTTKAVPDEPPPVLAGDQLGQSGWTGAGCQPMDGYDSCGFERDDGSTLALMVRPLRPIDDIALFVDVLAGSSCESAVPIDAGDRPVTSGCTTPAEGAGPPVVTLVFGNERWAFTALLIPSGEPGAEHERFLLGLRDRQLAAAGGEPDTTEVSGPGASTLDRFMPAAVPAEYGPPGGFVTDLDGSGPAAGPTDPGGELAFLAERTTSRLRLWGGPEGAIGVLITEYPYELLAGFALGTLDEGGDPSIEVGPPASSIADVHAVTMPDSDDGGTTTVVQGFRTGRLEFRVFVSGPDVAASARLASTITAQVADRAPTTGPTAAIHPPSAWASLGRAVLLTALVGSAFLLLRRLRAGRARPAAPLASPPPAIVDVADRAATLRADGRRLALVQLVACAVVVVGLVAEIGWWWVVVVAAGVLIGVGATRRARRRELAHAPTTWALGGVRASLLGGLGALLLVVGVGLATRALEELVALPSLTHLRWSEALRVSPSQLTSAMAAVGFACLLLAAVLLRAGRAHARAAARHTCDVRPPILYLRSFDDDRLTIPSIQSARRPFFELFGLRGRDPFEEGIAWELADHGPVTAVGRPGRPLATLGATRELLDPSSWQGHVAERMDGAGRIIVAIGTTEGLAWELAELTSRGHLAKTDFIVPPVAPAEQARRWSETCDAIERAAGAPPIAPVAIDGTFTLHVDPTTGQIVATRADKLDEAGYRACIEAAFERRPSPVAADAATINRGD